MFDAKGAQTWTRIGSRVLPSRPRALSKEAVGKVVGDAKLQAEGKADKAEGKLQNAVGGLKDTLRSAKA